MTENFENQSTHESFYDEELKNLTEELDELKEKMMNQYSDELADIINDVKDIAGITLRFGGTDEEKTEALELGKWIKDAIRNMEKELIVSDKQRKEIAEVLVEKLKEKAGHLEAFKQLEEEKNGREAVQANVNKAEGEEKKKKGFNWFLYKDPDEQR